MAFLACFWKNNQVSVVCTLLASVYVCRTFILFLFHLCRYVLKLVTWESGDSRTLGSNGTGTTCSTSSISLERLRSGPLWFYLYAWPGIFPEQWLNTGWQRPLRPPLLRSRHGRCRAAPQRWDLRRDGERDKESRWRRRFGEVKGARARGTAKDRQCKTGQGGERRLFPARSCSNELLSFLSPLTSCSRSRAASLSENNKMRGGGRRRETDTALTQRAATGRHTFALQNEGKREWKRDLQKGSE